MFEVGSHPNETPHSFFLIRFRFFSFCICICKFICLVFCELGCKSARYVFGHSINSFACVIFFERHRKIYLCFMSWWLGRNENSRGFLLEIRFFSSNMLSCTLIVYCFACGGNEYLYSTNKIKIKQNREQRHEIGQWPHQSSTSRHFPCYKCRQLSTCECPNSAAGFCVLLA